MNGERNISLTIKEAAAVAAIMAQLLLSAVAYGRLDQSVTSLREDVREIRNVILRPPAPPATRQSTHPHPPHPAIRRT